MLSNGEKFRCDLARALTTAKPPCNCGQAIAAGAVHKKPCISENAPPLVVFDEFTSVVDRTVAKVGSMAVSKLLRFPKTTMPKFVAVTCHYDVAPWLSPDWILDMASCTLARRKLRRPELRMEVFRSGRSAWDLFKKHHYLSHSIPGGAQIYVAHLSGLEAAAVPVGIVIVGQHFGNQRSGATEQGTKRISRIVVLPDFQGIGIGSRLLDGVAGILRAENWRVSVTTSHPGMIAHLGRSKAWKVTACEAVSGKVWTTDKAERTGKRKKSDGKMRSGAGRTRVSATFL
jgi:GNAT superfamily N-acetyltransferase